MSVGFNYHDTITYTLTPTDSDVTVEVVPEPGTAALTGFGLLLGLAARRCFGRRIQT